MERFFHTSRAEWFCQFTLAFPAASSITCRDRDDIVQETCTLVGRKVAKQQFLEESYKAAQSSIALPNWPTVRP